MIDTVAVYVERWPGDITCDHAVKLDRPDLIADTKRFCQRSLVQMKRRQHLPRGRVVVDYPPTNEEQT
jgi:hypothetical protein